MIHVLLTHSLDNTTFPSTKTGMLIQHWWMLPWTIQGMFHSPLQDLVSKLETPTDYQMEIRISSLSILNMMNSSIWKIWFSRAENWSSKRLVSGKRSGIKHSVANSSIWTKQVFRDGRNQRETNNWRKLATQEQNSYWPALFIYEISLMYYFHRAALLSMLESSKFWHQGDIVSYVSLDLLASAESTSVLCTYYCLNSDHTMYLYCTVYRTTFVWC